MKKYCCVPQCPNQSCGMTNYFNIPQDFSRKEKWIAKICGGPHIADVTEDGAAICCLHFQDTDYVDCECSKKLAGIAVPSVFPWTSNWNSDGMETSVGSHKPMLSRTPSKVNKGKSLIKPNRELFPDVQVPASSDITSNKYILNVQG